MELNHLLALMKTHYVCTTLFIGLSITAMSKTLLEVLSKSYPHINFKFYFRKGFTIDAFFKKYCSTDMLVYLSMIYKYTCNCCQQFYISSTALQ